MNNTNQTRKYPTTVVGLYKNKFSEKFSANSMPLDQERADQMCAAIQASVGGRLELREWGGKSKNGKDLPDYALDAADATILADRKAFGAAKKAEREVQNDGDGAL